MQQKKLQGSVLVFTLLVLSILLSVALSATGIVILGKNSSRSTEKSALAFQVADGAAENILKRVYKDEDDTLESLAISLYGTAICADGRISGTLPSTGSGSYSVMFLDIDGNPLACDGPGNAAYAEWRPKLARIVASGTYGGTTRAIDVSVKPAGCADGVMKVTDADGNDYDTIQLGGQCWMKQNMRVGNRINTGTAQSNNAVIEKYCYNNNNANCTDKHPNYPDGGLYTWNEAMQYSTTEGAQGICPAGWHIPTDGEWYKLEDFVDSSIITPSEPGYPGDASDVGFRGTDAATKLMTGGSAGFEGNYAGVVFSGSSMSRDSAGAWWTSRGDGIVSDWNRYAHAAGVNASKMIRSKTVDVGVYSVRCIED